MAGNGRVFVSHTHDDNDRCLPLLAALDAWGIDYWFDTQRMDAGQVLTERIQNAIQDRDIFIRVCTAAAQGSFWMDKELGAFVNLQAVDHKAGQPDKRRLVPIRLDAAYQFRPFELDTLYIDAVNKTQRQWLEELGKVLVPITSRSRADAQVDRGGTSTSPAQPSAALPDIPAFSQLPPGATERFCNPENLSRIMANSRPGDRIVLQPGTYRGNDHYGDWLSIQMPLELVGQGNRTDVIITGKVILHAQQARLANLTLSGREAVIEEGRLFIDGVDVVSATGYGVAVGIHEAYSDNSNPYEVDGVCELYLNNSRIRDCSRDGVYIASQSRAAISACEIVWNRGSGVSVLGAATMNGSRVNRNADYGIVIQGHKTVVFEDNDLRDNGKGPWNSDYGPSFLVSLFSTGRIRHARNLE